MIVINEYVFILVPRSCNAVPLPKTGTTVETRIDPDGPGGEEPIQVNILSDQFSMTSSENKLQFIL